ncbi:hypothetical protein PWT90_04044 [Aphanocladium album]|nr:hypothetical protein PWT90_04044 [Aphanocladium album]
MSSPDPLNDPATPDQSLLSSNTRRVTRSQRAAKFLSLGTSPRKQAYELEGGSNRSSRSGLVVSVEEEGDDTRRTLFPTPSPGPASARRSRERTTTTVVPLKYSIEDESSDVLGSTNPTPRPRKTRIRTSNGTPIPKPTATSRKRRAPTPPARRTPRRPATLPDSMDSDSMSDAPTQRSPTPKRRARTPRTRVAEPSSELGTEPLPVANSIRRSVRRRRQAMAPNELVELADVANNAAVTGQLPFSEDDLQRDMAPTLTANPDRRIPTPTSDADPESDIWMTTMSQDATPKASAQARARHAQTEEQDIERAPSVAMSEGDYGYLAPAASDVSSADDEPPAETMTIRRNDTIAQGEDFSMILMDSIPSLQASTHGAVQPSNYSEIGDDTNLIINNTLESLRQGDVADQEDEGEDDENDDADTLGGESESEQVEAEDAASESETGEHGAENEAQEQSSASQSEIPESESEVAPLVERGIPSEPEIEPLEQADVLAEQDAAEMERYLEREITPGLQAAVTEVAAPQPEPELEAEATPIRQPAARRSSVISHDLQLSQSSRKPTNSSPLRHRVLKQSAAQAQGLPRSSLPGADSPDRTPRPRSGNAAVQYSRDDSVMYEDSFSEIPQAVLEAATPRRPRMATEFEEMDDEEMDGVMESIMEGRVENAVVEVTGETVEEVMVKARETQDTGARLYTEAAAAEDIAQDASITDELDETEPEQESSDGDQADHPTAVAEADEDLANAEGLDADLYEEDDAAMMAETRIIGDDEEDQQDEENGQEAEDEEEASGEPPLPSNSSEAHSEATHLPTPEPALHNIAESPIQDPHTFGLRVPRTHSLFNSPVQARHIPQPSPTPRSHPISVTHQAETAAQRSGSSLEETPRNQISSPIQQPQSLVQESTSAQHIRPALSSIVRVGRVLQSVTSDPPSPEAGDRHLGSPFRSSGSKEPRSGSKERDVSRLASRSPSARILSKSPTARMLTFGKPGQPSLSPQRRSPQRRSPFRERTRSIEPPAITFNQPQPSPLLQAVSPPRPSLFGQSLRRGKPSTTMNQPKPNPNPQPASVSPPRQSIFSKSTRIIGSPAETFDPPQRSPDLPSVSPPQQSFFGQSMRQTQPPALTVEQREPSPQSPAVSPARQSLFRQSARRLQPPTASLYPQLPVSPQRQSFFRESTRSAEPVPAATNVLSHQDEAPQTQRLPLGHISANSSLQHSPPSDGEMSWIANEGPMSPNLRGDNTLREVIATSSRPAGRSPFLGRSAIRPGIVAAERTREPEPELEAQEPEPAPIHDVQPTPDVVTRDDETDIWEFEAQRETPKPPRHQPFGTSTRRVSQTPRRTGIPSPWMRKSIQASSRVPKSAAIPVQLAVDEPGSSSRQDEPSRLEEDGEEYSLLARRRAAEEAQKLSDSAAKASKFDLSSFFSSPAAIPGMLADKFFPGRSKPAETTSAPAPARSAAPVMTSGNMFPQVPQMEFVPSSAGRRSLFSSASTEQAQDTPSAVRRSESPATPEQLRAPKSSANQNFTPRARQTSHTFAQPSSTAPTAASATTPPRMQLSHADIRRWQHDAQQSSTSSNASEDSFVRPLLRPLPPKHASPTKSSLRSPLKPRTPGRVVEFTSSVLSPLEQAQARHQRQISQSMLSQSMSFFEDDDNNNEPPVGYEEAEQEHRDDKENQDSSDVSMADAPPIPTGQGTDLSQTAWTRQHWLLLDELIQVRRQGPFEERYERCSDKYLGKTVKSQGEAMQLERWHLDCVDAFKAEVGGWDEGALAKRLFALLLGELRRNRRTPQRRRRSVMFH